LVFHSSTIAMMHGPINIRSWKDFLLRGGRQLLQHVPSKHQCLCSKLHGPIRHTNVRCAVRCALRTCLRPPNSPPETVHKIASSQVLIS